MQHQSVSTTVYTTAESWSHMVHIQVNHDPNLITTSCVELMEGVMGRFVDIYYWNKVTVHHLKLCYFLMKKDNTMICGVLLNHCLTVNRIISKSVCLDTRLRDTSLKRCGVKSSTISQCESGKECVFNARRTLFHTIPLYRSH